MTRRDMKCYDVVGWTHDGAAYCADCGEPEGGEDEVHPVFADTEGEMTCDQCGCPLDTEMTAADLERWREKGRDRARGFSLRDLEITIKVGYLMDPSYVEDLVVEAAHEAEEGARDFSPFEHIAAVINRYGGNADAVWEAFDEGIHEVFLAEARKIAMEGF